MDDNNFKIIIVIITFTYNNDIIRKGFPDNTVGFRLF